MERWQSGLLPYPVLLAAQALILVFQFALLRQMWAGGDFLVRRRPTLGVVLKWFSAIYFVVMFVRYVITVWLPVETPWSPVTIPIYFHWVLALYVYVLSRYHRGLPVFGAKHR